MVGKSSNLGMFLNGTSSQYQSIESGPSSTPGFGGGLGHLAVLHGGGQSTVHGGGGGHGSQTIYGIQVGAAHLKLPIK